MGLALLVQGTAGRSEHRLRLSPMLRACSKHFPRTPGWSSARSILARSFGDEMSPGSKLGAPQASHAATAKLLVASSPSRSRSSEQAGPWGSASPASAARGSASSRHAPSNLGTGSFLTPKPKWLVELGAPSPHCPPPARGTSHPNSCPVNDPPSLTARSPLPALTAAPPSKPGCSWGCRARNHTPSRC